ncbi:ankyrin repeat protein, putative [Trichomonas vaginalis G3]|uniref:Ankyrin repeat protein, putative n=1 Tax=Trichomonas vaginalis (strain ATCC PRA-98 / G3) TaxID=412133 RepID=A2DBE7_TRIV3|nr:spectrin binding [Trichomonas vaginalis G3]EAY22150.1 ankyrin repeat protein, putative [Trichomonas vaginalis G3]KAI5533402.1 spectrin binding [Trichomonas vaginalis G3]|eukprot:XP_001583136.1 ankyrin repeat protein [Trichomonas vaginalis G3]
MDPKSEAIRNAWQYLRYGNYDEFQNIYEKNSQYMGPDSYITEEGVEQQTFLMIAAYSNSKNALEYLVGKGANVEARNFNGYSALHFAAQSGAMDAITFLANLPENKGSTDSRNQRKINIDCRTTDGKTPLFIAASRGHIEAVNYLLSMGAEVDASDSEGYTPLMAALIGNHKKVVETLVAKNAEVFHMTANKLTPSIIATEYKRTWFKEKYIH